MSGSRHLARQAAVQALYQWDLTQQGPEDILRHFIQDHDLKDIDQAYFQTLVSEVPPTKTGKWVTIKTQRFSRFISDFDDFKNFPMVGEFCLTVTTTGQNFTGTWEVRDDERGLVGSGVFDCANDCVYIE